MARAVYQARGTGLVLAWHGPGPRVARAWSGPRIRARPMHRMIR